MDNKTSTFYNVFEFILDVFLTLVILLAVIPAFIISGIIWLICFPVLWIVTTVQERKENKVIDSAEA